MLYFPRHVAHFVRRMRQSGFAILVLLWLASMPARADITNAAPDFKEVYELVRAHVAGLSETELNQAAVEGFLTALRGKVTLVSPAAGPTTNPPALAAASLLESNIAYVRLAGFEAQLPVQFSNTISGWSVSNSLAGLVLDLRFARSEDYAGAAAFADLFQSKVRPLLDWGQGVVQSQEKSQALRLPVAVLVNRDTGGAAEALAALLRETGVGLILGGTTSGNAMIAQEFPLTDGRRLRVATTPVKIGDGKALSPRGVPPDISVAVELSEERIWLNNPYGFSTSRTNETNLSGASAGSSTNRVARRPRPNEADLVRARRDGVNLDAEFMDARESEPAKPLLRDPVLARAVDVLKGLAVVRALRS